ncbi:MAG: hypothetical protein M3O70_21930, partial [Actinomycetota bacterium]|nr:hypothetical protein [Actinomycetota bacterium]
RDLLAVGAAGALGALLGPLVVANYLWVADNVGPHGVNSNELFAAQAREDHKSFLRLHLDRSGELTLYPVAVPRPARWRFAGPELGPTERWFEPDAEPVAELVEDPIVVCRRAWPAAADDG